MPRLFLYLVVVLIVGVSGCDTEQQEDESQPLEMTIAAGPNAETHETTAKFVFDCNAEWCGYSCRLNGQRSRSCNSRAQFEGLDDGEQKLVVRAVDGTGQQSASVEWEWTIDTDTPELEFLATPHDEEEQESVAFEFQCLSDNCERFECGVDTIKGEIQWEECSSPHEFEDLDRGERTVSVRAFNEFGAPATIEHRFVVDTVKWKQLAAGDSHSCAIADDGTMWCWGDNQFRQLGQEDLVYSSRPIPVIEYEGEIRDDWTAVDVGESHSCGLRDNGTLWCWGRNNRGQLGDGKARTGIAGSHLVTANPQQVVGVEGEEPWSDWHAISAGDTHSCGIRDDATLWCWGGPPRGGMGVVGEPDGRAGSYRLPAQVVSDDGEAIWSDWEKVAAASGHTCGLRRGGTLWCWGNGSRGRLGAGLPEQEQEQPEPVPESEFNEEMAPPPGLENISVKQKAEIAEMFSGIQPGNPDAVGRKADSKFPARVVGADEGRAWSDWSDIDVGSQHSCGVRASGTLWCWGNEYSLGADADSHSFSPVSLDDTGVSGNRWVLLDVGSAHSCAMRDDQTVWCWGSHRHGQLGPALAEDSERRPNQLRQIRWTMEVEDVEAPTWSGVAAGASHSCGTTDDASIWCWGENRSGQLGDDSTERRSQPVAVAQP